MSLEDMFREGARFGAHSLKRSLSNGLTSSNDVRDDPAGHVRQPEIASAIPVSQLCMIKTEQVEDSGMQVMHMHRVFRGLEAQGVSGAARHTPFNAAPHQPHP